MCPLLTNPDVEQMNKEEYMAFWNVHKFKT